MAVPYVPDTINSENMTTGKQNFISKCINSLQIFQSNDLFISNKNVTVLYRAQCLTLSNIFLEIIIFVTLKENII